MQKGNYVEPFPPFFLRGEKAGGDTLTKSRMIVLKALMANPRKSDRNIGKAAGVSQPTVTRMRDSFLKTGIIESYEIIPNLQKLGFEILAFATIEPTEEVKADKRVVYAIDGGQAMFIISVHKNYSSWAEFASRYGVIWSFKVPTDYKPMVALSFKNIPL